MAKSGFTIGSCKGCVRSTSNNSGWVLCVGAGVSLPIFPLWRELTHRLINWAGKPLTPDEFSNLTASSSLDSLVQAVFGVKQLPPYNFVQALSRILYGDLKAKADTDWAFVAKLLALTQFGDVTKRQAEEFLVFFHGNYPTCSSLQIAEAVGHSIVQAQAPAAMLSFNVEPLLFALINCYIKANTQLAPKKLFDVSIRGLSYKSRGRIPYYYCHGLVPQPGQKVTKTAASLDKLVFSESEYLNVAGSMFSWQSAVFLEAALSHCVVFVGLSFADSNLRRWLGFVHANRVLELKAIGEKVTDSTQHYWINRRPKTRGEQEWIEAAVAHLGVRLVWVDEWSEVGEALEAMLSLK